MELRVQNSVTMKIWRAKRLIYVKYSDYQSSHVGEMGKFEEREWQHSGVNIFPRPRGSKLRGSVAYSLRVVSE
ncbi:hypothetical protein TNCV_2680721 [Trichonephila clavipes]|uniref:Uncharacterized protein n=1 Tax=Trichonephila clavipes TaxID=2585209 RepID=A0A8X6S7T9_TRICX|nr:hypothetical protein TNCV_2680721 [Trichonephila clavipes]